MKVYETKIELCWSDTLKLHELIDRLSRASHFTVVGLHVGNRVNGTKIFFVVTTKTNVEALQELALIVKQVQPNLLQIESPKISPAKRKRLRKENRR